MTICPYCGAEWVIVADVTRDARSRRPQPGDLGVCETCGGGLMIEDIDRVRAITEAEYQALPADTRQALDAAKASCKPETRH